MQEECKTPVIMLILRGFSLYNQRQTVGKGMLRLSKPLRLGEPVFLVDFVLASSLPVLLSIFMKPK